MGRSLAAGGDDEADGHDAFHSGVVVHLAAEGGRGVVDCGLAGAVEYVSACVVYRGAGRGPETETDAVHDPTPDRRGNVAFSESGVSLRGSGARGRVPDGFARRARGGADWRGDYYDPGADGARMAGHAGGVDGRITGRPDPPGDSRQGDTLEFRALHFFEYSQSADEHDQHRRNHVGNAAVVDLCGARIGPRGTGDGHKAEVVVCDRPALELAVVPGGDCDADVGGFAAEDLE